MITIITEQMLSKLRVDIKEHMAEKRYLHTLGVEREIEKLAAIYCPEKTNMLRAAALLHDLTKEYTPTMHLEIMRSHGVDVSYYEWQSKKIYHSLTASLIIGELFPDYASEELVHAVSVHTTGCADMSIEDKLLYLADYIEDTRTFEDCITLRNYFWDGIGCGEDMMLHLDKTMLLSFDMTIKDLIDGGKVISDQTVRARNSVLLSQKKEN